MSQVSAQGKNERGPMWAHQIRTVGAYNAFFNAGGKRCLVVMPTGGGKSRCGQEFEPDGVFVHTNPLKEESRKKFPYSHVLTIQGSQRPPLKRILVDEAHHFKAEEWGQIFTLYPDAVFLGLTATPERGDGRPLDMFQHLIVGAHYSELLRGKILVPCQTIYPGQLVDGLAMDPIDAYFEHGGNRRGFIFCGRNEFSDYVSNGLRLRGIRAESIGSHLPGSIDALGAFRAGQIDVLCAVNMVSEGVDIPEASLGILASTVSTQGQYLQKVGRILRASPGKNNCRLIDLVGAIFTHGLPTQDRLYSLDGMAIQKTQTESVTNCPECGACYLYKPKCPRCGFKAEPKAREVKITRTEMVRAAERGDKAQCLALLLEKRKQKQYRFWWVVSKYKEWFDESPDLSQVSEIEKDAELQALKIEGKERGYKTGYAYARYNETFG